MNGYIAVTDPGWYERLSSDPGPREANFWRPSTRRYPVTDGTPFLFKLRAPWNAIGGFGFFVYFTALPDWLAWETFGEANGMDSLDALRNRLGRIRRGAHIAVAPSGYIGCGLIAEARFFSRDQWVSPPRDWRPRTQTGATYDLTRGEGLRVWQECLARAALDQSSPAPLIGATEQRPRYGTPLVYRPRLGQGIFRVQVLDAYGRACSVTGEHSLPVLEAAHIQPYADGGPHAVPNGLALRTDLHRLFDRGYITIDEQLRLVVGRRLKDDFDNGRSYYGMSGQPLILPHDSTFRPSQELLGWHRESRFLG